MLDDGRRGGRAARAEQVDVGAAAVASLGADGVGLRHEHGGCEGGAG